MRIIIATIVALTIVNVANGQHRRTYSGSVTTRIVTHYLSPVVHSPKGTINVLPIGYALPIATMPVITNESTNGNWLGINDKGIPVIDLGRYDAIGQARAQRRANDMATVIRVYRGTVHVDTVYPNGKK